MLCAKVSAIWPWLAVSTLYSTWVYTLFFASSAVLRQIAAARLSQKTQRAQDPASVAIVVLKYLSDAQRASDDIHVVLCGTAVMHGGYSTGLTTPIPGQDNEYMADFDKLFTDVVSQVAVISGCHTHYGLQQ